jgi:hypothetical protein
MNKMAFNIQKCYIPTVYCGDKERQYPYYENDNLYTGKGTTNQCMRKGFGAASAIESKKNLAKTNLQQIRYVGPKFEQAFIEKKIEDIPALLKYAKSHSATQINKLLRQVFLNANGSLNGKGLNSTLIYLYKNGNSKLPQCVDIEA